MHQLWNRVSELFPHMPFLVILTAASLIGVVIIVRSYTALYASIQRKHWPRIQAKIIRYEVKQYTTGGQSSRTRYSYESVSYYEIQDQSYLNEHDWNGEFTTWRLAENRASQMIGEWIELIYNPLDPQQSRPSHEIGWNWSSFRGILLGIAFLSMSLGLLLAAILFIYSTPWEKLSNIIQPFLIIAGISTVVILCSPLAEVIMKD